MGGWSWLFRDGRLRTPWRVLLFVLLLIAILQLLFSLQPPPTVLVEAAGRDLLAELVFQGLLLLIAALAASWIMLRWVDHRPLRDLGFGLGRGVPGDLGWGIGVGAAGPVVVVLMLGLAGAYRFPPDPGPVLAWAGVVLSALLWLAIPAAAEEAVFRGYLFRTLTDGAGAVVATLITSLLFALVHGSNPNVSTLGLFNIFLAGVMLALAVLWTGSLWFASAVHLGWNWATAASLDLPVSGLDPFDPPLYDGVPVGPAWLTGGSFGPEGGAAGTAAAAAVLALVWWYRDRAWAGDRARRSGQ